MTRIFSLLLLFIAFAITSLDIEAQGFGDNNSKNSVPVKPYKILTTGKQVTIKGTRDLKSVMLWSTNGKRILEQRDINASNFSFRVPGNEKVFFLRVMLTDGKSYSEKIGVQ